jgi:hypothetical protein
MLPPWPVYSLQFNLDKKEALEDFSWFHDEMFKDMRQALEKTGLRDWLALYPSPREGFAAFSCTTTGEILSAMVNPPDSGGHVVCFFREYQYLLNNWDAWVKEHKEFAARKKYTDQQITQTKVWRIVDAIYDKEPLQSYMDENGYSGTTAEFIADITAINQDYRAEDARKRAEAERRRFQDKLGVLEHHYNHPKRWYDGPNGSFLFGHPASVSAEHIAAMELRIPGYTAHLAKICATWNADYRAHS